MCFDLGYIKNEYRFLHYPKAEHYYETLCRLKWNKDKQLPLIYIEKWLSIPTPKI